MRINESLSGVSTEAASLGNTLERAEGQIERMQARAAAIDALLENGALVGPGADDPVERELRDLAANGAVEAELAALKQTLNL